MPKLMTKEIFLEIFSKKEYRDKLDKIILNFFGLETTKKVEIANIKKDSVTLKFVFMINTEVVLNILIEDTKKLFQSSKIFYINISFREVEKYHVLLMPCYWEIYAPYSFWHLKEKPKLILIAALFNCQNKKEIENILKKLKTFSKEEIKNVLKVIP